ncbi:hypothetical protein F5878DRAFT_548403 [Lentinula raphanica]|uniref:Uncharacterized protein n=1 Tax=Lentinula raphanica TaxID=153919 RepID=A0AA38NX63_9AGAR|nr:hypothetical protein F5878DRAFT_548403 [Lentinula raphanica]
MIFCNHFPSRKLNSSKTLASFLESLFPEYSWEIPFLQRLPHKHLTAYKLYRQYRILSGIANALHFPFDTREITTVLFMADGTPFQVSDIYFWVGVNEGTLANHKRELRTACQLVAELEAIVQSGAASPALQRVYQVWYPFLISCEHWALQQNSSHPLSLKWSWANFGSSLTQLQNILATTPTYSD